MCGDLEVANRFGDLLTTGWRRLIGYLKLQVILRKRATKHRALLQRMTYEDKACYGSSPPCTMEPLCACVCARVRLCVRACVCAYGVATISRLL